MDDAKKKADRSSHSGPDEKWVDRVGGRDKETLTGVVTYVGLLRQSPADDTAYQLYLSLDMGSCLYIQKQDVVHWEDLPARHLALREPRRLPRLRPRRRDHQVGHHRDAIVRSEREWCRRLRPGHPPRRRADLRRHRQPDDPRDRLRRRVREHPAVHRRRLPDRRQHLLQLHAPVHDRHLPVRPDPGGQDLRRELSHHQRLHLRHQVRDLCDVRHQVRDVRNQLRHLCHQLRHLRHALRHVPGEHVQHEMRPGDVRRVHPHLHPVQPAHVCRRHHVRRLLIGATQAVP